MKLARDTADWRRQVNDPTFPDRAKGYVIVVIHGPILSFTEVNKYMQEINKQLTEMIYQEGISVTLNITDC